MIKNNGLESKNRFSLRKLTIGLVGVSLGTIFYLTNAQITYAASESTAEEVKADNNKQVNNEVVSNNESKKEPASILDTKEIGVSTNTTNTKGEVVASSESSPITMIATQDMVNINTQLTNIPATVDKLEFSLTNVGTDQAFSINAVSSNVSGWDININTAGNTITAIRQKDNISQDFKLSFPLLAKKESDEPALVNMTVTDANNNQTIFTKDILVAKINKLQDKITKEEIIKGFSLGDTTTVENEEKYGNISAEDKKKLDLSENQTVLQWGVYFNYGLLTPLENVKFDLKFGGDQILIPSSIKVYKVPEEYLVDKDGNRKDLDSYYSEITKQTPIADFANFLRSGISSENPNTISIDHPDLFTHNGNDYSKDAYLFLIDTALPNNKDDSTPTSPGEDDIMHYVLFQGTGQKIEKSEIVTPKGVISGGGEAREISKEIMYTVNYLYENGKLESTQPFESITKTIYLKSVDKGKSWEYSTDKSNWYSTKNNVLPLSVSEVPSTNIEAGYKIHPENISVVNGSESLNFKVADRTINLSVSSSLPDKTRIIINVPYYLDNNNGGGENPLPEPDKGTDPKPVDPISPINPSDDTGNEPKDPDKSTPIPEKNIVILEDDPSQLIKHQKVENKLVTKKLKDEVVIVDEATITPSSLHNKAKLPQTGKNNSILAFMGLIVTTVAGILGIINYRKKD